MDAEANLGSLLRKSLAVAKATGGVRQLPDAALIREVAWSFPYYGNRTKTSLEHVAVPASHTRYMY